MYYLDIDGTLSRHNMPVLLCACNEHFALGIDDQRLSGLHYQELLEQPEARAVRDRLGEQEFVRQLAWIDFRSDVLRAAVPLPGALDAVRMLSEQGPVQYLTCRTPAMMEDTSTWLSTWRFPEGEVLSAHVMMNKWIKLASRCEQADRIFLIDDGYHQLLAEFDKLYAGQHPKLSPDRCRSVASILAEHVTLVAFGDSGAVSHEVLSVVPLPSWQDRSLLHKGGIYARNHDATISDR